MSMVWQGEFPPQGGTTNKLVQSNYERVREQVLAVTNLKCNLDRRDSRVKLRWVSYIRGIVVVDR